MMADFPPLQVVVEVEDDVVDMAATTDEAILLRGDLQRDDDTTMAAEKRSGLIWHLIIY
jgi:hypothetical protein